MQKKKKTVIALVSVLTFIVLAVCVCVPCIYEHGLLGAAHPLNKAKDGQIRVACVGDSLTYGHSVSGWSKNNYPKQLGNNLGDGYCVNNYGYSGRTASFIGNKPYVKEKLYRKSLDFAPDIVVIMLGSNDTKSGNWRGKEAYKEDYKNIVESYLALDSVKKIIIMSPTPVWLKRGKEPYGINIELIATDIYDTAKELADELDLEYIDLFNLFADKGDMFKDGAHPDADGAKIIAETVRAAICRA